MLQLNDGKNAASFGTFVRLSNELCDSDVNYFLGLLDDYCNTLASGDEWDLSSLLRGLSRPRILARAFWNEDDLEGEDALFAAAFSGLRRFMQFSVEFDRFLSRDVGSRLLASAYWHVHGYWYQLLSGPMLGALATLLRQARDWAAVNEKDPPAKEAKAAALDEIVSAELAVKRLTSSWYCFPLESALLDNKMREGMDWA